jgi:hypothetical protein
MLEKKRFVDPTGRFRAAPVFLWYFEGCNAQVPRIADWIVLLLRQNRAKSVCETEIDEVVEAPCGCPIVPDGIKALDYIRAPVWPSACSFLTKSAVRRQRAEMQQEVLFHIENRILADPSV